jgi:allophanate hydrolase subunit 2
LAVGKTFMLGPGEVLTIGGTAQGMRSYLCVQGGIQTPIVLGSRSSLAPLRAGDWIDCLPGSTPAHFILDPAPWLEEEVVPLRVLPGTHSDWFAEEDFYGPLFQATTDSNRMGTRLLGRPLTVPPRELISQPVCPGTVQVMRDGQCIILGVDGQTIGGYPRIAQVVSADIDRLGQLRPGQSVRFERVTLEQAERLYHSKQTELRLRLLRLRVAVHSISRSALSGPQERETINRKVLSP